MPKDARIYKSFSFMAKRRVMSHDGYYVVPVLRRTKRHKQRIDANMHETMVMVLMNFAICTNGELVCVHCFYRKNIGLVLEELCLNTT